MTALVDTFYAIDFDRCLGNVEASFNLLQDVVKDTELDTSNTFMTRRNAIEKNGETFRVYDHFRSIAQEADIQRFTDEYISRAHQKSGSLLQPGAQDFIDWLKVSNLAFGIISYGEPEWQESKIIAAGLGHMPRFIVDNKNKAAYVKSWQTDDGVFIIPSVISGVDDLVAKEVVLIDDRATAFDNLPETARGYWVVVEDDMHSFQKGDIPENVVKVGYINEIIELEEPLQKHITL